MDIQKIDKNFLTRMPSGIDLRFYDADEVPFEVYGLLPHQQDEPYRRIPLQVGKESNIGVEYLSASTTGGRIRFRTNSRIVAISAEWPNLTRMNHMPLSGSSGFDLYVEEKGQAHYAKSLIPSMDSDTKLEAVADLETGKERNILMHFPLYQRVDRVRIGLEPQAVPEGRFPDGIKKPRPDRTRFFAGRKNFPESGLLSRELHRPRVIEREGDKRDA